MSRQDYIRRSRRRKKREVISRLPLILLIILVVAAIAAGVYFFFRYRQNSVPVNSSASSETDVLSSDQENSGGENSSDESQETTATDSLDNLLSQASLFAAGYDYDKAIELLNTSTQWKDDPKVAEAVSEYEEIKSTLVRQNVKEITHVFFHSLIVDTSKAFDGDSREAGYNQMMTTKEEFIKIMNSMYEKGFVLVRLHDMAYETTAEDGSVKFVEGDIMLPPGKKAFVLSEDDVCYYEYMDGDGFATKLVIGEDGKPTCEMKLDDGSVVTGEFDVVPILEAFIQEHPDFSYRGAKGILAFTGYNGILGYRTAASYSDSPTYQEDREMAAKVAECLKENGWELASHSWGHRNMGTISMEHFRQDTDKWEEEVESLIGPTDIILFPFGSDIGDWRPYSSDNERLKYLKSVGFRYFCNVDSHQYWVQIGNDYMRQGRRNLDGYRMYYDLVDSEADHLSDLFDVNEVFDKSRPTPVKPMS